MTVIAALIVRSSLVLAIGLIALWAVRTQPAALRHSILAAAIALAIAQPVINRAIPALAVPSLNWTMSHTTPQANVTVKTELATNSPMTVTAMALRSIEWPFRLLILWMIGVVVSVALLLLGIAWLFWLQARSRPATGEWLEIEQQVRRTIGCRRGARIAITHHPALIVTWGVVKPAILLPIDADAWCSDRKHLVIAHELAHLRRCDWVIQVGAEIARSLNWFNPLFWIACAALRRESEYAADDLVLDTGITGASYASHLVDLARSLSAHGRTWLPAPSMARPSTLERRVLAMLNPRLNRRPVSRSWELALIAGLCAVTLPIAAAGQATSSLNGRVTDRTGRPLVEATLRLTPARDGDAIETRSDGNGEYQFPPVTIGDYMLAVVYPGFSGSRQRVSLTGGAATMEFQAQVGTLRERITVESASPDPGGKHEVPAPAQPSCSASQTGGQIIPPMKIRDVRPRYKAEWRGSRLEGEILMKATIGTDGKVRGVDVISGGNADLEDEAMAAVAQWGFSPTYLNCEPIEVQMYVTVSFKPQ